MRYTEDYGWRCTKEECWSGADREVRYKKFLRARLRHQLKANYGLPDDQLNYLMDAIEDEVDTLKSA